MTYRELLNKYKTIAEEKDLEVEAIKLYVVDCDVYFKDEEEEENTGGSGDDNPPEDEPQQPESEEPAPDTGEQSLPEE